MASVLSYSANSDDCVSVLAKALQSGHINFLIGSGASLPAIETAGSIEAKLDALLKGADEKKLIAEKFSFLSKLQISTNTLIAKQKNQNIDDTLGHYQRFLQNLSRILDERKTDLLPKQITIFTTNYDLFVESAAEALPNIQLNDGFVRNPSVRNGYSFQSEHYFDVTFKTGSLFKYRYPLPTVNLIKLHGSLSWCLRENTLSYSNSTKSIPTASAEVDDFVNSFSLILPTQQKHSQTLLTRVYYDLLRIFANTLEVENAVLISFGFSFADDHIVDIVTKALKNPTLLLIVFSYDEAAATRYQECFARHNNVLIIKSDGDETITFSTLNSILSSIIPKSVA